MSLRNLYWTLRNLPQTLQRLQNRDILWLVAAFVAAYIGWRLFL